MCDNILERDVSETTSVINYSGNKHLVLNVALLKKSEKRVSNICHQIIHFFYCCPAKEFQSLHALENDHL